MAREETLAEFSEESPEVVALYDYLYRDTNRLSSYSAQLFGSVTQSVENSSSTRKSSDRRAQVGPSSIAVVESKGTEEVVQGQKLLSSPHDVMTNEILTQLMLENRITRDVAEAPHGSLVMTSGTVVFMDRNLIRMAALVATEAAEKGEAHFDMTEVSPEGQATVNFSLAQLFSNFEFPSAFLLQSDDGSSVCGTLKETGMEEPISTYYFKHGKSGLANVHLIGVKEVASATLTLGDSSLLSITQDLAQSLSDLLMPPEAIRVTPIALFREL